MEPSSESRASRRFAVPRPSRSSRSSSALVELVRLSVVVLATAAAYDLARASDDPLIGTLLGAGLGYVVGGVVGRLIARRIAAAQDSFTSISSPELLAAAIGGLVGLILSAALTWPVLLFGGKLYTVPVAALVTIIITALGVTIGRARGGDLLHALGATGRLEVSTPSGGRRAKILDTSALIDGRILDVCRAGFIDGTIVVPSFVLFELQGLADAGDEQRRARGRRGLDVLAALQRSAGVALEVAEQDFSEIADVDAKLLALARARQGALVTVDGNLGRIAEVSGVAVLNLHALADRLRPPVNPGDVITVRVTKPGRERDQGVGHLADGTMVVVEGGRDRIGADVAAEVTSILSNPNGRMVFATAPPADGRGPDPNPDANETERPQLAPRGRA